MELTQAIIVVVISTVIGAFGALYLKYGANQLEIKIKAILTNGKLILGLLLYGISTIFFITALKGNQLSYLYPFASLSYIWVVILSKMFLKEQINKYKVLGILFIVGGVVLIGLGS